MKSESCIHTHIHIYAHTYTKCTYETHASTPGTTARQQLRGKPDLTPRSSAILPVRCNPVEDYPSWPAAQLPVHEKRRISAEQPQPTAAHRTITTARRPDQREIMLFIGKPKGRSMMISNTARRPDHIRLSALVRSRSTQFTAHPSCQLGCGPPKRGHFSTILAVFFLKVTALEAQPQRVMDLTKKGGKWEQVM